MVTKTTNSVKYMSGDLSLTTDSDGVVFVDTPDTEFHMSGEYIQDLADILNEYLLDNPQN